MYVRLYWAEGWVLGAIPALHSRTYTHHTGIDWAEPRWATLSHIDCTGLSPLGHSHHTDPHEETAVGAVGPCADEPEGEATETGERFTVPTPAR